MSNFHLEYVDGDSIHWEDGDTLEQLVSRVGSLQVDSTDLREARAYEGGQVGRFGSGDLIRQLVDGQLQEVIRARFAATSDTSRYARVVRRIGDHTLTDPLDEDGVVISGNWKWVAWIDGLNESTYLPD